jgi:hypothetical protein
MELFKKYSIEPIKGAIGCSINRTELLILTKLDKNGNEIGRIMGQKRLADAMANR